NGSSNFGQATFQNATNSTNAFEIQNASNAILFNVDTSTTSNLVTTGGFDSTTLNWAANGAATISQSTAQSWQGNDSLSVTTTAAIGDGATYTYSTGTLTNGNTYTLSFYLKL